MVELITLEYQLTSSGRELGVLERTSASDPLGRIEVEHLSEEVDSLWLHARHHLFEGLAPPRGKVVAPLLELADTRPAGVGRGAESAEYLVHLVNLGVAHQERFASVHFGEDAADGPHVDLHPVLLRTQQDLGRTLPQGDHLVGVGSGRLPLGARQAEVSQFCLFFLDID